MNHAERREYLRALEQLATNDPSAYRRQVSRMMWQARWWLHGLLASAVVIAIAAVLVWWYAGWINLLTVGLVLVASGMVATVLLQTLFFSPPEPYGVELPRNAYPLLFRDLRELRQKIKAPRFHSVRFTLDFNAAMSQVPRWHGLLPSRNYLMIGLPLLHTFSRGEFLAVLAHELAHLSRQHNRFTLSAYRLRTQVLRMMEQLDARRGRRGRNRLATRFVGFLERFDLVTRRLQREHEFEADRLAAMMNSPAEVGQSLLKVHAAGRFFGETLMRDVDARMIRHSAPNVSLLQEFLRQLRREEMAAAYATNLRKELSSRTEIEDSHPSLRDRLAALQHEPASQWVLPGESAAQTYFGRDCEGLTAQFDKAWVAWITPYWRARYDDSRRAVDAYRELHSARVRQEKQNPSELWALGVLEEQLALPHDAVKSYERFLTQFPDALEAKLPLGRLLLDSNPRRGEELLREVVAGHPLHWYEAASRLRRHFLESGRPAAADEIETQIDAQLVNAEEAFDERLDVRRTDTHVVPALAKDLIDGLYRVAGELGTVATLWLLEHKPRHFCDVRAFVILFAPAGDACTRPEIAAATAQILANECYLPGTVLAVSARQHGWLRRRARKLPDSEIFSRRD